MKIDEIQPAQPLRILAVSPGLRDINPVVNQIKKQLPEGTKLISAGRKNTDIVMSGFIRVKRKHGQTKDLIKEDWFSGTSCVTDAGLAVNESAFVAIDHLQRRTKQFTWRYHTLESACDSKHYYHIVFDLLQNFLAEERINLVLFFDLPHLLYDTLIYQIAKAKGIRTLVISGSLFPNRFFSLAQIEDVGIFPLARSENLTVPYPIDPGENPSWDYMKGIKQLRGELGKLGRRGILRLILSLAAVERKLLLKPNVVTKTFRRMRIVAAALPKWRDPFRRHFHTSHLDYYERILQYENVEIDFDRKFVYFPLQYQPEMTTSTLGGEFSDQVLAIEHLLRILPDDTWIYVKENPKQTGAMRGPQFFDRLDRIPNLKFLPSYANTFELVDKSVFVATITGTVGWEAICKGKNVLVFGMPWYRSLPGAIQFHKGITYEMILDCKYEHATLEQQTGELLSRSHFADPQDSNTVAETIVNLIENRTETTFMQT